MKTQLTIAVVILLALSFAVSGAPIGSSNNPREYLVNRDDLGKWSAGAGFRDRSRDVWVKSVKTSLSSAGPVAFVGYDLLPWVTVYATGGAIETDFDYSKDAENRNVQWGGGLRFNLLDHAIADPTLFEDRIRITGLAEYTVNGGKWNNDDLSWGELYASLIFSLVNEVEGNKLYLPYAIALYGGPIFSNLDGDINEKSLFGAVAGIDIFLTSTMALQVEVEQLNATGYMASLRFQF
ncbi:MAG: outer membrane protein [Kiritimatiellia bacterium]